MAYPPGMTKHDFIRAGIDDPHDHDHEWLPMEHEFLLLEDGGAYLQYKCEYVEGRWGEGWACEKTKYIRLEPTEVVLLRTGATKNIRIVESNFDLAESLVEDALMTVENRDLDVVDIDEPNRVTVRVEEYEVTYGEDW